MAKDRKELLKEVESFYFNTMIDQGSYLNFLDTMSKFHKYNLREQINIFYNAPENSTALASENIWKRMKRTLKSDAVAIPIIRGEAGQERVELIYDVSDTNEYRENEELLWHIDEERDKEYLDANLQGKGSVEDRVRHICMQMAEGFEGSDEEKNIMGLSLSYVTLKRMGYDASDVSMELISTPWELENPEKVLTEVNTLAKSILNPMGNYVKNGRTNQNDRSRLHISADNTDSRGTGGRNGELGTGGVLRTMGEDQNGVSDRGKEGDVEEPSSGRESGEVSEGLSGEVRPEIRQTVRNDDGERRSDGGTESQRRDGMDSQGETREASGNGDDNSGNQRDGVEVESVNETQEEKSASLKSKKESKQYFTFIEDASDNPYFDVMLSSELRNEEVYKLQNGREIFNREIQDLFNFHEGLEILNPLSDDRVYRFNNDGAGLSFVHDATTVTNALIESYKDFKNEIFAKKDNGESAPISENNAETAKSYIIKEDYTATNENGESQTHYIAYNSIETGDKITELTGNKAFLEINEIAEKYSGYLNIPSHDNDVPNFGHFSFNTQEDRDAFAIEANAVIDKILANETSTEKDNGESALISENNAVEEEPLYKYYLNARLVSPGTVPRDFVSFYEEDDGGRYGAIYYNRKLSEEEIKEFELTPAPAHNEKYGKLVFQEQEMYSPIRNRTYYHALPSEDIPVATLNMLNAIPTAYPKTLIGGEGDGKAFFSFENPQDRDAFIAEANNFIDYANNYHSSEQYNLNKNFSLVLEDSEASENVDPDLALPYLAIPKEEVLKIDSVNALASLSSIARNYGGTTKGIYSNDGLFYRFSTNEAREAFINDTNMFISYIQSRENPSLSDDFTLSYSKINDNSQYYFYASPSQDFTREFLSPNSENINYSIAIREYVENLNGKIFYTSPSSGKPVFGFTNEADRNNFINNVYSLVESVRNNVAVEEKDNRESASISENSRENSEEKFVQIGRNNEEEKLNLANEEATKIVQETIKQIGALPRYAEFAPIDSIEKADEILTEADKKLRGISAFKNGENKKYFREILNDSTPDILYDGLFKLSKTEDGRFIADLDKASKLKKSALKILEELIRENVVTPIKNPFSPTTYILSFDTEAERKNFIQLIENKLKPELSKENTNEIVANNIDETSTDSANSNANSAVIDYNEMFDKIDNILREYGEQKINLAGVLEQLENIDKNENVNRNIFITDRITKVSGFIKDTHKEIDDILTGYEKKEYESAEALRRLSRLKIDIGNRDNLSNIEKESVIGNIDFYVNDIREEREKLFAEQEAEAARINAEREKNESAQTSSTNATSSLFTDEEIKATEVKNTNTKDKKNIPEDSPFIISVSRKGLFSDKNFYEASISNSEIIQDLQDMQDLFKEIADNNNGESAFNLNWKFTFDSEADRDNFVIAANDAINARNAEKTNEVTEENSVQNEQNESEYYIYFTKEGKFGRELVINNHPTRNKENMYKVAAEQGATIISKEEYEKGLAEQRSKIATDRMKELFREDNIEKIFDVLSNNDNTYSIKAFSELSGISLDKTWKRRKQQLIDYYGEKYTKWQEELETAAREKEEAEKEAQEENFKKEASEIGEKYFDYAKNLSPMQRARVSKILGTTLRYDDKIQTRAQNIEELFSDGRLAFTYNDFGKIKYAIESSRTGSYYSVTKTEFDYWNYLNENSNVKIKPPHFSTYSHAADEQYVEYHFAYIPKEQASARYQSAADLQEISKKYGGYLMTDSVDGIESVGFSFKTAENMNNFAQEANTYLDQQYGATDSYGEAMSLLSEEETANEEKIENQNEAENTGENPVQNEQDFTEDNKVSEDSSFVQNIVGDVDDFMNLVEGSKTDLPPIDLSSIDFDADMSTVSGKRAVFVRNIAAIRIMKQLEATNREATPEEAKVLQSYAGFGGMSEVFDSFNASWTNEFHTLEKELTAEEYKTARESTLNAHFTPDNIVQSIYDGLSSLGFENGYVLEPSAGSGKFFLNMPEEMRKNSKLYGVELDSLTARIAAKAYNDVTMANQPFEQTNFADGSFDVAISNVPFGDYRVTSDNKYRGKRFYVHDYFINKMIDEVRPGGLVVAITSKGTMEKDNVAAREEIARKAELVTAIRLPDDTFKEAGTSVTTDILVFKKRDMPLTKAEIEDKQYSDYRWVYRKDNNSTTKYEDVNSYFTKNIGNVLGKFEETTTPWGKDLTLKSTPDIDVNSKIKEIFASVGKIYEPSNEVLPLPAQTQVAKSDFMGFAVENGEVIFHKSDGTTETPELTDREKRKVISAIQLRDITRELFKAQRNNCSDEELREHQKKLNQAYDEYNRLFGRLYKDRTLKNIFKDDPSYGLLLALEVYNKDGFQGKADIFTKRTISPDITPTHADSAADALAISIGETGSVDFPYMKELTGLSYDEIRKDLEFTSIYQDTDGSFYTSDEFLSGNIRRKIAKTEIALAEAEAQEKELLAKVDGDEWKTPPVYNMVSPHEHYLQERIDRALEKGGKFVQQNEGRLNIAPNDDTHLYIHNKIEENDKDFLLFITGAAGNLRRLNATATEAKKNPLFVLDALKYKISATYSYSYDGNLGVVSECLKS